MDQSEEVVSPSNHAHYSGARGTRRRIQVATAISVMTYVVPVGTGRAAKWGLGPGKGDAVSGPHQPTEQPTTRG